MPKVSAKRQITLPASQCEALGIQPGDEVESFVADGRITLIKKVRGAAKGILSNLEPKAAISDRASRDSVLE